MKASFHDRCLALGTGVFRVVSTARRTPASRDILDQLVTSGASIGANANEARGAESRADFIHKMGIALKEARETAYWLAYVDMAGIARDPALPALQQECSELIAILVSSVTTAKRNLALNASTEMPSSPSFSSQFSVFQSRVSNFDLSKAQEPIAETQKLKTEN